MSNSFNKLIIYNGYPLSVVVAITFHSVILALLLYLQSTRNPEALELIQPTVIKALMVQENPQVTNERKRLQRQQQTIQQQADAQRAAEAERQRLEQAQAQAQIREEQQRQERAALHQRQEQEQERLIAEKLQREQEREQQRKEQEQRRQRELAEAQRQQENRDRELQRQQEAADAAELATSEFEMVQSGTAIIQQLVQGNWSRPPSARNGMQAILQIRMLPTGELVDAAITQTSGDPAFDRSAENAVYRAAPFRELQNLPIKLFNANFRSLSLIFEPEDLLN